MIDASSQGGGINNKRVSGTRTRSLETKYLLLCPQQAFYRVAFFARASPMPGLDIRIALEVYDEVEDDGAGPGSIVS